MTSRSVLWLPAALLLGCATTPVTEETGKAVPAERVYRPELAASAVERTAKVVFTRDAGISGAACTVAIRVDDQEALALRSGEYQALYLAPGRHSFEAAFDAGTLCPADFATRWSAMLADGAEQSYRVVLRGGQSGPRIAVLGATAEEAAGSPGGPPFKSGTPDSPGHSLALTEIGRSPAPNGNGTEVRYRLHASGFPADSSATVWWKRGDENATLPAPIDASGAVQVLESDELMISEFVSGQSLDLTLVSGDQHAHAWVVPFPIEAHAAGYHATADLISENGLLFLVSFRGFEPAEKVELVTRAGDSHGAGGHPATPEGVIILPVIFEAGSRGRATVTATGSRGPISIEFAVGKDALVVR